MAKYDIAGYYCEDCDKWHYWLDPDACHLQPRKKPAELKTSKDFAVDMAIVEKKMKGPTITIELLPEEVEEILRAYFEETIPKFPKEGTASFERPSIAEYVTKTYVFTITPPGDYWK